MSRDDLSIPTHTQTSESVDMQATFEVDADCLRKYLPDELHPQGL